MPHEPLTEEQKLDLFERAQVAKAPVIFAYYSKEGNISARAVMIEKVAYNQRGQLYITGMDSLSKESRSFVAQNMQSEHLLDPSGTGEVNTVIDWNDVDPLYFVPGIAEGNR